MADAQPIDYTSKDYAGLRQAMLDDALVKLPEWTSRDPNDFGVVLIEEFAYLGDIQSYYTDRVANESYLPTATLRQSLLNIVAAYDYRPDNGQPSQVTLSVGVVPGSGTVLVPQGSQFASTTSTSDNTPVVIFETDSDLYVTQDPVNVIIGTVTATQGETTADEAVGTSDGTQDQSFSLLNTPVIEGSVFVSVDEGGVGATQWNFIEYLIDAGPSDAVFTTATDAQGVTSVVFGDDVNGRVPIVDAVITATYRTGGGVVGNVGANSINQVVSAPGDVTSVTNPAAAEGGTDPETNDQIRTNAPKSLSTLHRAVSLQDYANLCLLVAGVAKANAAGLTYTAITVYIAPVGGGTAGTVVKNRVLAYLADKKMVNAHVTLEDPVYVPVNISVGVEVAAQYAQSTVVNACRNALAQLLDFENVDFAQQVTLSGVYQTLAAVPGVVFTNVTVLARSTDIVQGVSDLQMDVSEIPTALGGVIDVTALGGGITDQIGGSSGASTSVVPGAPGAPVVDSLVCDVSPAHHFTLQLHWTAGSDAINYAVILDFFNGTTYLGSQRGGVFSNTNGVVTGVFTGADTVRVHVQAINGPNVTDGPPTSTAYTC